MKRKPFSFFILDTNGNPVRRFSASVLTLWCTTILGLTVVAGIGYTAWDYYRLTHTAADPILLEQRLGLQAEELAVQKQQLTQFKTSVDDLQSRLENLRNYEHRIRTLARIEKSPSDQIYGLGGSSPEDVIGKGAVSGTPNAADGAVSVPEASDSDAPGRTAPAPAEPTPVVATTFGHDWYAQGPTRQPVSDSRARRISENGAAFSAPIGAPVHATAGGVVAQIVSSHGANHTVIIDHGHGFCTRYTGAIAPKVAVGERVARGAEIAQTTGSDGQTDVAFDYQVLLNGLTVNPIPYLLHAF